MYRFLLSRQWVILTLLALLLIPGMVRLGFWQLHRHEHRVAQNEIVSSTLAAPPVDVNRLTSPGHPVPQEDRYRTVRATGRFDTDHEVVVRRRTDGDDKIGFHVLTPLVMKDGRAVLVNRGWIPADGPQTAFPEIPAPPRGEVRVTGRLMPDETTAASGIKNVDGLPDRQIMLISSRAEARDLHREVLGGYVQQTSPAPAGGSPELLPAPDHSGIGAHMAYAVQWWLFAAAVPVGWVILVRRERRDRLTRDSAGPDNGGTTVQPAGPVTGPSDGADSGAQAGPAENAENAGNAGKGAATAATREGSPADGALPAPAAP